MVKPRETSSSSWVLCCPISFLLSNKSFTELNSLSLSRFNSNVSKIEEKLWCIWGHNKEICTIWKWRMTSNKKKRTRSWPFQWLNENFWSSLGIDPFVWKAKDLLSSIFSFWNETNFSFLSIFSEIVKDLFISEIQIFASEVQWIFDEPSIVALLNEKRLGSACLCDSSTSSDILLRKIKILTTPRVISRTKCRLLFSTRKANGSTIPSTFRLNR